MTKQAENLSYGLTMALLSAVACLPLWVLYGVSDLMYVVVYRLVRYRLKMVRKNLRRAFPEASEAELKRYERGYYRHLCDLFVETVKLLHISDREIDRRVEVIGGEMIDASAAAGKSVVLMLGHYGNWEWVPAITRHFTTSLVTTQIYHPLKNKPMDRIMLRIRSRFGAESIPMKRTVRRLFEIQRSGRQFICGFIADQRPMTAAMNHWTDFFGIDTPYVTGGETIGNHVGADYFYLDVEKTARGHYRLTFREIIPPADDTDDFPYTRSYLRLLEQTIRRDPRFWLWSHNRWKRSRPQ